jgi:hypothetical protein
MPSTDTMMMMAVRSGENCMVWLYVLAARKGQRRLAGRREGFR